MNYFHSPLGTRSVGVTIQASGFHRILVEAGTSNTVGLCHKDASVARLLLSGLELETPAPNDVLGRLNTALALHKRLPTELLRKIFRYVACGNPMLYPPRGQLALNSPQWSLRHVCSSWRKIASLDPILWRDIYILLDALAEGKIMFCETLSHIGRQLSFYRENILNQFQPLRINLDGSGMTTLVASVICDAILRPNAAFVTEITVSPCISPLRIFSKVYPSVFSTLKRLCTYSYTLTMMFRGDIMPNLTSLEVWTAPGGPCRREYAFFKGDNFPSNLPWAYLTDLVICTCINDPRFILAVSLAESLRVLRLCHRLQHCTLQVGHINGRFECVVHNHIDLPHLRSLRIYQTFGTTIEDIILDFLVTPSLIALEYYANGEHAVGLSDILPFIRRSKCDLEDLILDSKRWTTKEDYNAEAFFELTPSLQTFYAPNHLVYHGLIPMLLNTTLLPKIKWIGISHPTFNFALQAKITLLSEVEQKEIIQPTLDLSALPFDNYSFDTTRAWIQTRCRMVFYRKCINHTNGRKSTKFESKIIPWDDRQIYMQGRVAIFKEFTSMTRGWNDTIMGHFWFD